MKAREASEVKSSWSVWVSLVGHTVSVRIRRGVEGHREMLGQLELDPDDVRQFLSDLDHIAETIVSAIENLPTRTERSFYARRILRDAARAIFNVEVPEDLRSTASSESF